ncbi:unnamed protein product [Ixodes persulcatus]
MSKQVCGRILGLDLDGLLDDDRQCWVLDYRLLEGINNFTVEFRVADFFGWRWLPLVSPLPSPFCVPTPSFPVLPLSSDCRPPWSRHMALSLGRNSGCPPLVPHFQQGEGTSRAQGRGFVPLAQTPAESRRPVSRPLCPSRLPGLWLWSASGAGYAIIDRDLGSSEGGSPMFGCVYTFLLFVGVPIILV